MQTSPAPASGPAAPWKFLEDYRSAPGTFDEVLDGEGRVRGHCERFVRTLEGLGRHELVSRWENARRAIRDNGVTYNVYGDPEGVDRPWTLDLLPFLIPPDDWNRLESALLQRTRLCNALLADIYGAQRLVEERRLPPSLVLGNPAFLRACHGIPVPNGIHLHLHAVDLARRPDGEWVVLADRTQAPSGAGYALENRIVLSRSLPEAFRDCQVQRLAPFFRAHRDTLNSLAQRDRPRVVLLTPGPLNETYFEHAYLARYLGFTLVEGADLTVRDRRVFIKTLDGLHPVDVIVRRLDDSYCDPLELRTDSSLGVAGLVDAARCGNVVIANALGSGVIETPALAPYLPALCRMLLGEELQLSSVPARWCGVPADCEYVVDNLERMVVKRTFPVAGVPPIFARLLSAEQRASFADEIRARPDQYVGQDEVPLSHAPVWVSQRLEARALVLRVYIASAGESYVVMPGGLTRASAAGDLPIVSMQRGGGSKDTWVLSDGPVSAVTLLTPASTSIRRERRWGDLPSRVADNLFWLGRHAERAEHTVRLLRAFVGCLAGEDTTAETPELVGLLHTLVDLQLLPERLREPMRLRDLEHEVLSLLFKQSAHAAGLHRSLADVRRNATAVRDRLSNDTWRILNQLRQDFRLRHGRIQLDDVLMHLNRMIADLAAFSGMEMENMTRGHGWRFLEIGRRLERSADMATLLQSAITAAPFPQAMLGPLLDVADSTMTYRRQYFAQPQLPLVLDLLLADPSNARSLAFQAALLTEHVAVLPRERGAPSPTKEQQLVDDISDLLRDADYDALAAPGADGRHGALASLLGRINDRLRALSDTVTYYYFSHAEQRVS